MQQLLSDFGRSIGIPNLAFDEHHYCCLLLDDLVINMEHDPARDDLFLYAHLGHLPSEPSMELYETLLEANFFFRQTAGGVLGIDKATGILTLARRQASSTLTLTSLEKLVENFANTTEYWTKRVASFQATPIQADQSMGPGFIRA